MPGAVSLLGGMFPLLTSTGWKGVASLFAGVNRLRGVGFSSCASNALASLLISCSRALLRTA
jgi:hypothetical protein